MPQGEDLSPWCWADSCLKQFCWDKVPLGALLRQLVNKKNLAIDLNGRWSYINHLGDPQASYCHAAPGTSAPVHLQDSLAWSIESTDWQNPVNASVSLV